MARKPTIASNEKRGRGIKRPPTRLGRFLVAMRNSVGKRAMKSDAHPAFRKKMAAEGSKRLSREQAALWVTDIAGYIVLKETIRKIENGQDIKAPSPGLIRNLCIAYGLSEAETELVVTDANLNTAAGANPHLIAKWRMRELAVGELGPAVENALRVGEYASTWVEVEKGNTDGFHPDELSVIASDEEVAPPPAFCKLATEVSEQNSRRKEAGIRGWSDNSSIALAAITNEIADDREERKRISLHLQKSWYRYGVVAKETGSSFRWNALQEATSPLCPVPYLASGLGICINVICRDDKGVRSIVLGQRSNDETFRKGEFDVAVVEGLRPSVDIQNGKVELQSVALRALDEELGLSKAVRGKTMDEHVRRLVIFELGCDLEYYQWNFLAFAEVTLSFEELHSGWQRAKDRNENKALHLAPFEEQELIQIFTGRPIWSAGMACALRTFDYF